MVPLGRRADSSSKVNGKGLGYVVEVVMSIVRGKARQ
jgi:hypothetical protein